MRFQPFLEEIVHPAQTTYVLGKYIGTTIRKVQDVIDHVRKSKMDHAVLFLDFHKAFDSVSHIFLWSLMLHMQFPSHFVEWIILLYCGMESTMRNRGWFSAKLLLGRGVHQGCPISCHLFNFVSQVTIYFLASSSVFIWWTFVGDPASLYADDVAIVMKDLTQLGVIIKLIQECGRYTGLQLNLDKTVVYSPQIEEPVVMHGVQITNNPMK